MGNFMDKIHLGVELWKFGIFPLLDKEMSSQRTEQLLDEFSMLDTHSEPEPGYLNEIECASTKDNVSMNSQLLE